MAYTPPRLLAGKKRLFEGGLEIFSRSAGPNGAENNRKHKRLTEKLKKAQEVITELTTENLELRKNYSGEI